MCPYSVVLCVCVRVLWSFVCVFVVCGPLCVCLCSVGGSLCVSLCSVGPLCVMFCSVGPLCVCSCSVFRRVYVCVLWVVLCVFVFCGSFVCEVLFYWSFACGFELGGSFYLCEFVLYEV